MSDKYHRYIQDSVTTEQTKNVKVPLCDQGLMKYSVYDLMLNINKQ